MFFVCFLCVVRFAPFASNPFSSSSHLLSPRRHSSLTHTQAKGIDKIDRLPSLPFASSYHNREGKPFFIHSKKTQHFFFGKTIAQGIPYSKGLHRQKPNHIHNTAFHSSEDTKPKKCLILTSTMGCRGGGTLARRTASPAGRGRQASRIWGVALSSKTRCTTTNCG